MITTKDDFEVLLNEIPLNCECSSYEVYIQKGGNLPFGTYLRKNHPVEFEQRRSEWNSSWELNKLSMHENTPMEVLDELLLEAQNGVLSTVESSLITFSFNEDDENVLELELPPLNEAEFFATILWGILFPREKVVDPSFVSNMTDILYNIADKGRLHSALVEWIANKLLSINKATDTNDAMKKAQKMLDDYEDYKEILQDINAPVQVQKEPEPEETEEPETM